MATGFGALRDDEVATSRDSSDGVANLSAHAGDENVVVMAELDDIAWNAKAGNKDPTTVVDDGLNLSRHVAGGSGKQIDAEWFVGQFANALHLLHHAVEVHC